MSILEVKDGKIEAHIPTNLLRQQRLFIATPMYGGQCAGYYAKSLADLAAVCKEIGLPLAMYFMFNESLITRARNYCVDEFLRARLHVKDEAGNIKEEPFTHLLFLDSDIGFNPQDVLVMLALSASEDKYDVMGAPYPKKCISWEKIKQAVDKGYADKNPNQLENCVGDFVFNPVNSGPIKVSEPVEILETGTGFMMIKRKCFEAFEQAFPHHKYKPDHVRTKHFDGSREITAFFDCIIDRQYDIGDTQKLLQEALSFTTSNDEERVNQLEDWQTRVQELLGREANASKRYLSEDYKFCQDLRKIGQHIWLCPWMKTQHVGAYVFGGSLLDLAAIGANPTADQELLNKGKGKKDKKEIRR